VKSPRAPAADTLHVSHFTFHDQLPPRPWRPGPLHWVTGATHVAGVAALVAQPTLWPWAIGAIAGNHAVNLAFGLAPATGAFGPVVSMLPAASAARAEIALTFDDGPDPELTPRVLDLLDSAGARATFFCVARRARAYPALVREIVARGHAVENHSFAHSPMFGFYGIGRLVRDIGAAQRALADITGVTPRFFRAPFGIRTPLTEPALAQLGLTCVAWNIRSLDSIDRDASRVAARIARKLAPGAIVLLHDGTEVRRRTGVPSMLGALPELLQRVRRLDARCVTLRSALIA
jgi:peptidoglycan/xylan/chitin deacetylase (PgdA/CDA1 family)